MEKGNATAFDMRADLPFRELVLRYDFSHRLVQPLFTHGRDEHCQLIFGFAIAGTMCENRVDTDPFGRQRLLGFDQVNPADIQGIVFPVKQTGTG